MEKLIIDINKPPKNAIKQVAEIHSRFEKIHPFSDGNGRIGRLIMAAMLLRYNIAPAIIQQKQKRNYYKYLNHSQQQDDFMNLEEFIADAILEGFKIIE